MAAESSGWWLGLAGRRATALLDQWAMDHTTTLAGSTPILALDMYEHSYHMDYGARAGAVDAFVAAINWPNVGQAYGELRRQAQSKLEEAAAIFGKNHDVDVVTLQRLGNSREPGSAALSDVPSEQPHRPEPTLSRAAVVRLLR